MFLEGIEVIVVELMGKASGVWPIGVIEIVYAAVLGYGFLGLVASPGR